MSGDLASIAGPLTPYLVLVVVGFLPSEIWRWLAVFLARNVSEGSELLIFVRAVATALLTGVVAKLLFAPTGQLAAVPLLARLGALGGGFAVFLILRRSVFAGVIVGEVILIASAWWMSQ